MPDVERRYLATTLEARAGKSDTRTIGGYGAVYNRLSENLGGFVERVDPGFFAKSKGDGWPGVVARYQHDDSFILGTSRSGTLRLSTDDTGLLYEVDLPESRADVYELVQRGERVGRGHGEEDARDRPSGKDDERPFQPAAAAPGCSRKARRVCRSISSSSRFSCSISCSISASVAQSAVTDSMPFGWRTRRWR